MYITLALGILLILSITLGSFLNLKESKWVNADITYIIMAINAGLIIYVYLVCNELLFYAILANAFVSMTNYLFAGKLDEPPIKKLVRAESGSKKPKRRKKRKK